jgi:signal transduction histidine kinase
LTSFSNMAGRLAATDVARSRFLADLTHELRTPLATLEAYIDGLEDDVVPHDAKSYATMRDQVERLRRLSLDLRDASAAEEHALNLDLDQLDARIVAAAAVSAAAPRYQAKGVDLGWDDFGEPCWITGDRVRLQQVLGNLLDNALRHTPAGGQVEVESDHRPGKVLISVTDTGEGIPPTELDAVFDRFRRIDPSRVTADGSGSGLGLTIARAIVVDHAGTLEARSDGLGFGSTFVIELPPADGR